MRNRGNNAHILRSVEQTLRIGGMGGCSIKNERERIGTEDWRDMMDNMDGMDGMDFMDRMDGRNKLEI